MKSKTLCNDAFNIRSWHFEDKQYGYDVTAARIGDSIVINGTKGEKAFKKSLLVDSLPWYQPLEFSLLPFLISGRSECKFWMIRPTDMKAFTMIAHHKTIDSVQVNGRLEKAIKVTLSPHGIAGKFWRATYWYGVNDYSFLKNEAPGLFGASPMTIESIPHPGL